MRKTINLKRSSRIIAVITIVFVVITMTLISNMVARRLQDFEKDKMTIWAEAYRALGDDSAGDGVNSIAMQIISNNETIPLLITDKDGNITSHRNIRLPKKGEDEFLQQKLSEFIGDSDYEAITISFNAGGKTYTNYIYYGKSKLLSRLSYFPIWQSAIIIFFLSLAYRFFNLSKRAEEDSVWVGLSKETAHQLGTPISSLLAWIDLMKSGIKADNMEFEMEKDISRLQTVAERFSKIGSKPTLEIFNVSEVLNDSISYMSSRISKKITITKRFDKDMFIPIMLNCSLFEWVVENLIKNSVDAMRGGGDIEVSLSEEEKAITIDFKDSGKGIPKNRFKEVFNPGYSSKDRGWGLGLSLTKRIIDDYHNGKIFVKQSEIDKGTTFRIILPKSTTEESV
jgi:two-component system, sporulation sensor kinase D